MGVDPGNSGAVAFYFPEYPQRIAALDVPLANGGIARGTIAAMQIPMVLVTPGKWKKFYSLSADKEQARARAIQYWPASDNFRLKKHHGRAEAALLAKYGAEHL